jgi:hypothetical protein
MSPLFSRTWQLVFSILENSEIERWRARLRARTASNFKLRVALLLLFSLVNILVGAALYKWSSEDEDWGSALFTVYAVSGSLASLMRIGLYVRASHLFHYTRPCQAIAVSNVAI